MDFWVGFAAIAIAGLAVLEVVLYGYWRRQLYLDYIAYYNQTVIPHVPEAWRSVDRYRNTIDFTLEWEMFRARLVPAMEPDLVRRLKIQRVVVLCVYLPVAALIGWAFFERYILGNR